MQFYLSNLWSCDQTHAFADARHSDSPSDHSATQSYPCKPSLLCRGLSKEGGGVKSNTSTENLHASYRLLFQSQQKTSTTRRPTWTWEQAPTCGQVTPLLPLPPHSLNPLQMLSCFLLGNSLELLCEPAVFPLQMKRGELSQMAFFFVHFKHQMFVVFSELQDLRLKSLITSYII